VPVYEPGERVLAFLEPAKDGGLRTSGMFLGKFTLTPDEHGAIWGARDLDGHGLLPTRPIPAVERIPYMAPGLVGPEKAARGKLPTDTWWHTIVPTQGRERTGYPTQKPLGVLRRIVQASSRPGDLVLDFFAGSGTTGEACLETNRRFLLVDSNPEALDVMARRFAGVRGIRWVGFDPRAAGARRGATGPVA